MSPFTRCATAALLALALSPLQAAGPAGRKLQPTELFNYAEKQYAALFPTHALNQALPPYTYRQYPATGNYLGVASGTVYLLGPASGGAILPVGQVSDFYCAVVSHECNSAATPVASADALSALAARSGNALFLYQAIIDSIVFDVVNLVAAKPITGTPTVPIAGVRTLPCVAGGTGSATITDADNSLSLTPGDRISIQASNCVLNDPVGHPTFSGQIDITVQSGTDTHNYWATGDGTGAIELRIELRGLTHERGVLNGVYRFASSFLTPTSDYTETVSFDDLRVENFLAVMQFADVKLFFTDGAEQLARAEGAITIVTGIRSTPARLELSVPVAMKVDQSSIRPRPTTGTLRLGGYGYNLDLKFLGNRTLDLAADNGPDGSNDITRRVTELELDQQLVR